MNDYEFFNKSSPRERAQMIVAAAAKARGEAPPKIKGAVPQPEKVKATAEAILRAGRIRRGEEAA
jgi:hypothetical protein